MTVQNSENLVADLPPEQVFLFSSACQNPDSFFQGYCFVENDLVFAAGGHALFQQACGRRVGAAEDGNYVSVQRQGADFLFEADYSGYKKLFYYWSAEFWAVSNSLVLLLEHLQAHGVALRPNYAQLESIKCRGGSALRQMTSFHTIAEDVFLLPADCRLQIGKDAARLLPHAPREAAASYEVALGDFLELWLSRFETLLACASQSIVSDLTGGVDSRVVFALLNKAQARLGAHSRAQIRIFCGSSAKDSSDLRIARMICQQLDVSLNVPLVQPLVQLPGLQVYRMWRYLHLGGYHPIYLRNGFSDPRVVFFSGGGGENHRLFYGQQFTSDFVESFINSSTGKILSEPRSWKLGREMRMAMEHVFSGQEDSPEPLIRHYRHFRNRFHAGRASQHATRFCPLASAVLDSVSGVAGLERLAEAQIHHDLLYSLNPQLLDLPFDKPEKAPSAQARRCLTRVDIRERAEPGQVFCDWQIPPILPAEDSRTALEHLAEDFGRVKEKAFVREFCGDAFLAEAEGVLKEALRRGSFRHANDGEPISAVMAAGLFAES